MAQQKQRKKLSDRFKAGETPSETRATHVRTTAAQVEEQKIETQNKQEREEAIKGLEAKRAKLQKELDKALKNIGEMKNHTNVALQQDLAKLLSYASTEFRLNQKELLVIAVNRLLVDLKADSKLLQLYL